MTSDPSRTDPPHPGTERQTDAGKDEPRRENCDVPPAPDDPGLGGSGGSGHVRQPPSGRLDEQSQDRPDRE